MASTHHPFNYTSRVKPFRFLRAVVEAQSHDGNKVDPPDRNDDRRSRFVSRVKDRDHRAGAEGGVVGARAEDWIDEGDDLACWQTKPKVGCIGEGAIGSLHGGCLSNSSLSVQAASQIQPGVHGKPRRQRQKNGPQPRTPPRNRRPQPRPNPLQPTQQLHSPTLRDAGKAMGMKTLSSRR